MQIRQNVPDQQLTIHPEWAAFIRLIGQNDWALSNSSQKRVDALIRTQIRERHPFYWFCMMAYQNGFLFTNKQKEFFRDKFAATYKWIQFQQENIDDVSQRAIILTAFTAYDNDELNAISLLSTIYSELTASQQTKFRKAEWYLNVHRWFTFANAVNLTKSQQDSIAQNHAETMICTNENTEAYRRMLGKIYHSRMNPLTNEQKIKMRESYPEIDFLVDVIHPNNIDNTNKRRRVNVSRWSPEENHRHKRASIISIESDDNDSEHNDDSSIYSDRDGSSDTSSNSSSTSSSESSSSFHDNRATHSSSSSSSDSDESMPMPPALRQVDEAVILPMAVVSPISLFQSLRNKIADTEIELERRLAMRQRQSPLTN